MGKLERHFSFEDYINQHPQIPVNINKEGEPSFWDAIFGNLQSSFKQFSVEYPISDLELDESSLADLKEKSPEIVKRLKLNREALPEPAKDGPKKMKYFFQRFREEKGIKFATLIASTHSKFFV